MASFPQTIVTCEPGQQGCQDVTGLFDRPGAGTSEVCEWYSLFRVLLGERVSLAAPPPAPSTQSWVCTHALIVHAGVCVWLQAGSSRRAPWGVQLARGQDSSRLAASLKAIEVYQVWVVEDAPSLWPEPLREDGGWFTDSAVHARFVRRLKHATTVFCCLKDNPGWVWYDMLWDIPHRDRHNRVYGSTWEIKPGDQEVKQQATPAAARQLLGIRAKSSGVSGVGVGSDSGGADGVGSGPAVSRRGGGGEGGEGVVAGRHRRRRQRGGGVGMRGKALGARKQRRGGGKRSGAMRQQRGSAAGGQALPDGIEHMGVHGLP